MVLTGHGTDVANAVKRWYQPGVGLGFGNGKHLDAASFPRSQTKLCYQIHRSGWVCTRGGGGSQSGIERAAIGQDVGGNSMMALSHVCGSN